MSVSDTEHHTKWFGESWEAPVCQDDNHVDVPIGALCEDFNCRRPITECDQGFLIYHYEQEKSGYRPWHKACLIGQIIPEEILQTALKITKERKKSH